MTGKAGQQAAENRKPRDHISIDTREVEIASYTWSRRIHSQSLTPVGLPPAKQSLLKFPEPPQPTLPTGDQTVKHMNLLGTFCI